MNLSTAGLAQLAARRPEGFFAFVAVATLGEVALLVPGGPADRPTWDVVATAAFVATIAFALLVIRQGASSHLAAAPAYAFLVVVALWRHADGGALSGFVPLLALPVLWLALHGTWQQVWISVAGVAAVMVVPMVVVGAPDYPFSDWHRTVFWVAISALMGPLLHRQVRRVASQRELYRLLVGQLPGTTIGLADERLTWVDVAGRALTNLGLDAADVTGRAVGSTVPEESRSLLQDLLRRGFDGPVSGVVESAPGVWYEIDALPYRNEEQQDLLLVVARDVSARRRAEREQEALNAAVARSEERFRRLFENAPTGIALTAAEGEQAGRFLQVNEAFAHLLGRRRADLEGHPIDEVTHPDDLDRTTQLVHGGNGAGELEKRYLHASGRPVWAALSYTVLDDPQLGGRYFLTHVEDITLRKESERVLLEALERQRAAADALRAADLVRRDAISTVSHELRTPLTSIRGYVELLGEAPGLSAEERRMVDVVDRNAARLEKLVEDLLLLGQVDRGAPPLVSEIRLDTLVNAALAALEPQLAAHRLGLERVGLDVPCTVQSDRDQLDRAVTNVLANAIKYTPEGGTVSVALAAEGGRVRLSIADTGVGIAEEELPLLFDRFYRGTTAVEIGAPGTGLGLAIVKGLVELNGGTVAVRSTLGAGSVFTIDLPAVAPHRA